MITTTIKLDKNNRIYHFGMSNSNSYDDEDIIILENFEYTNSIIGYLYDFETNTIFADSITYDIQKSLNEPKRNHFYLTYIDWKNQYTPLPKNDDPLYEYTNEDFGKAYIDYIHGVIKEELEYSSLSDDNISSLKNYENEIINISENSNWDQEIIWPEWPL